MKSAKLMLPDFPKIKRKWSAMFAQSVKAQVHNASFVSQIRKVRHFEGDGMKTTDATGETEESNYKLLSGSLGVNHQDLIERGPLALQEGLEKMAEELRSQQSKMIFEHLSQSTDRTGNVVDAGGQAINPDLILQMLEKMEIDFSEDGQPRLPTLVVPPEQGEKLREKMLEWEKDECYNRKFNELIERKRQEWHDRESHRKLVD